MPVMDGLEVAAALARQQAPPAVIFTTAYGEHALAAFEEQAVDYLLKPVRPERLRKALERVSSLTRAQLSALAGPSGAVAEGEFVCAHFRGGIRRVPIDEVVYFLADQKYVTARHLGGELLLEDSLKALEERFAGRFVRIHRNALVAQRYLVGLEKDAQGRGFARLSETGERLEVSRRHLPAVRRWLRESAED